MKKLNSFDIHNFIYNHMGVEKRFPIKSKVDRLENILMGLTGEQLEIFTVTNYQDGLMAGLQSKSGGSIYIKVTTKNVTVVFSDIYNVEELTFRTNEFPADHIGKIVKDTFRIKEKELAATIKNIKAYKKEQKERFAKRNQTK